jgi:O-acetylhomoserine (thiol)-lyase
MKDETKCLHAGYTPKNGEPRVLPIVQSTTYVYDSAAEIAAIFDDPTKGLCYSRFGNPTVMAVEEKISALEGGVGAMCTASGQAATLLSVLNICEAGDSIISTPQIYGGTINLFSFTLKKLGIECIYVNSASSDEEIKAAFKPNTKLVFGETIANPALTVFDISRFAGIAHEMGVPLIVDNTFATPILCKPFEFGADIVTHSTSKYMDGHAVQNGGVIVDSGNFDWSNGKFPCLTEPDESYHGISYTKKYGKMAYIIKARMQLMTRLRCLSGGAFRISAESGPRDTAGPDETVLRECHDRCRASGKIAGRGKGDLSGPAFGCQPRACGEVSERLQRRHFLHHQGRTPRTRRSSWMP